MLTGTVFLAPTEAKEMQIFVRMFVYPVQTCLEQSIFIILAQIFKQTVRNKSAVSERSESTQSVVREQSEHQIRVNTVGAFKYCVVFSIPTTCTFIIQL